VQEIQDSCLRRQRVLYSHYELNMRAIIDEAKVRKLPSAINMRKVEYFDCPPSALVRQIG
jgi:hypothetical protein